jgi:hypothetical protein
VTLQRDRTLDHPELEFCASMQRDRTLDHPELEFCASNHVGGLVAPTWFCSKIGGLLPIAPWGRSSL